MKRNLQRKKILRSLESSEKVIEVQSCGGGGPENGAAVEEKLREFIFEEEK